MRDKYKKILFVTAAFPPARGGSVVVMNTLCNLLPEESFKIISVNDSKYLQWPDWKHENKTLRLYPRCRWARRFSLPMHLLLVFVRFFKAFRFARAWNPDVVITSYPSADLMVLAILLAKKLHKPCISYLHDTMVESAERSPNYKLFTKLQRFIFAHSARIAVISEGMKELYQSKYGLSTYVLPHVYPEDVVVDDTANKSHDISNSLFWSGGVYGINNKALQRVVAASKMCDMKFLFSGRSSKEDLTNLGIVGNNVDIIKLPSRSDYLRFLRQQGVLILALNDIDESSVGEGEIATIFPTKTIDYLASGRPILVHCPSHYFLAKFFLKHMCGLVVSDNSVNALVRGVKFLMSDSKEVSILCTNAMNIATHFSAENVMRSFSKLVEI